MKFTFTLEGLRQLALLLCMIVSIGWLAGFTPYYFRLRWIAKTLSEGKLKDCWTLRQARKSLLWAKGTDEEIIARLAKFYFYWLIMAACMLMVTLIIWFAV